MNLLRSVPIQMTLSYKTSLIPLQFEKCCRHYGLTSPVKQSKIFHFCMFIRYKRLKCKNQNAFTLVGTFDHSGKFLNSPLHLTFLSEKENIYEYHYFLLKFPSRKFCITLAHQHDVWQLTLLVDGNSKQINFTRAGSTQFD